MKAVYSRQEIRDNCVYSVEYEADYDTGTITQIKEVLLQVIKREE